LGPKIAPPEKNLAERFWIFQKIKMQGILKNPHLDELLFITDTKALPLFLFVCLVV
jgi:hypothetical protein